MRGVVRFQILHRLLFPIDILLKALGANYALFVLFFRVAPPRLVARVARLRAIRAARELRTTG
jgi:hypothetical protein